MLKFEGKPTASLINQRSYLRNLITFFIENEAASTNKAKKHNFLGQQIQQIHENVSFLSTQLFTYMKDFIAFSKLADTMLLTYYRVAPSF